MTHETQGEIERLLARQQTGGAAAEEIERALFVNRTALAEQAHHRIELARKLGMSMDDAEKVVALKGGK